ncbi:MAG: HD domain-containing protein [Candidatus Hermodarchaeota archaeon]
MSENNIFSKIRKFAANNSEKDDIHGFGHVKRVYTMSIKIGKELNANLNILKIAALLHDIGRIDEKSDPLKRNHAEISAEKALNYLQSQQFNLSWEEISQIIHCIKAHSFSNNINPQSIEAKILSDADKLDAIGAIGIFRTIGFTLENNGGINQIIEHLETKILKLKKQLFLSYSKEIAEKRHNLVLDFYNEMKSEKNL